MQQIIKLLLVKKNIAGWCFYGFLAIVFYLTLSPINKLEPRFLDGLNFDGLDKLIHLILFLILGYFLYLYKPKTPILLHIIILLSIGLIIEILQHYMPFGRSFDVKDLIFDGFGAIIGVYLSKFVYSYQVDKK